MYNSYRKGWEIALGSAHNPVGTAKAADAGPDLAAAVDEMVIVAPVAALSEIEPALERGAGEIYCGFQSHDDSNAILVNRRPTPNANLSGVDELKEAIRLVHAHSGRITLTLNTLTYTPAQHPFLRRTVELVKAAGVDTLIVSDLGLLLWLREAHPDLRIHLSTTASAFNSEAIGLFQDLGVKRVVLPRHLSLEEIRKLRELTSVELEVFIFGQRCINDDGQCTWEHGIDNFTGGHGSVGCYMNFNYQVVSRLGDQARSRALGNKYHLKNLGPIFCGFCAVYDLLAMGIRHFKIPGREEASSLSRALYITALDGIKPLLREHAGDPQGYRQAAGEYFGRLFNLECHPSLCYYPQPHRSGGGPA